ncbi:hypothetical protein EC970246_3851 [Escherichia coli 97.0246]|uniref:Uncharacterized protein n=1 Tax=Escherichia coli 97.0246 TaxID=869670 RepID=A0A8E0KSP7_ECOLX|nr:hypothetical protein EC970246_3851 [Escherichia coli 97.0246]
MFNDTTTQICGYDPLIGLLHDFAQRFIGNPMFSGETFKPGVFENSHTCLCILYNT